MVLFSWCAELMGRHEMICIRRFVDQKISWSPFAWQTWGPGLKMIQRSPNRNPLWGELGWSPECSIWVLSGVGGLSLSRCLRLATAEGLATPAEHGTLGGKAEHVFLNWPSCKPRIQGCGPAVAEKDLYGGYCCCCRQYTMELMKPVLMKQWEQWRLGKNMLSSLSSWYIFGSRMDLFKLPKSLVVLTHLGMVGTSRGRDWISQCCSSQISSISVFPFPITNLSQIPNDSTTKIKINPSAFPYFCFGFEMKKASLGPCHCLPGLPAS